MSGKDENISKKILLEYNHRRELHEDFLVMILRLLGEFIRENSLGVYSFDGAVMSRELLQTKLEAGLLVPSIEDIDDVVTIKVLTFFEDDVKAIANVLETEFKMLKGAVDKKELRDPRRFGYHSQFYLISMMDSRLEWIEYRRFKGCKVKVQVCSLLQHTWAKIQERLDIDKDTVPVHQLRNTARIVSLFELADRELNKLKNSLPLSQAKQLPPIEQAPSRAAISTSDLKQPAKTDEKQQSVTTRKPPKTVAKTVAKTINKTAGKTTAKKRTKTQTLVWTTEGFAKIVLDDPIVTRIDRTIADAFYTRLKFDAKFIDRLCEVASNFHISSQDSLLSFIDEHEKMIFANSEALLDEESGNGSLIVPRGISVLMLFYTIARDAGDNEAVNEIATIVHQLCKE